MSDSGGDTPIHFPSTAFFRDFFEAAHPLRFASETIDWLADGLPRKRDVWPMNTQGEIEEGYRLFHNSRAPLARITDGALPYGRILDHVERPFGPRGKKHFFFTYPDDKPVGFVHFDIDLHVKTNFAAVPGVRNTVD